jgi:signal transduction histidine kinase/ActR/RegA family two-component response regulator
MLRCRPDVCSAGRLLMGKSAFLYRWFRDISIGRKLYFTVGTMAILIGVELFVLFISLHTLSSLRAYVGGEGLWSKAQKDAVFHLYRYGVSHSDGDYQLFQQFMQVPIGDAKARRELLTSNPNITTAREGFLEGRNHPDDIDGMIDLFADFSNISYIKKAIQIWGDAQLIAMQLLPIGEELNAEMNSPNPSQNKIDALLASVYEINQRLTAFEDDFSFTLGEGSRWLERVVLRLLFATALTVEITGLLLTVSVSKGIHKGLTDVIQSANAFSAGELRARAHVSSRDEIGMVAGAFNEMADNLQTRMKELGELNKHLSREISERQNAEAKMRGTFAQLEIALHELQHETDERRRAEEMLRQSEKMRALGQLTGGIAHDFNNLLGVIIGGIEILEDAVRGEPEHAEIAHEILGSALSGSLLTRRLLAVGRNQPLQPERVNMNALLADVVDMLRRTIGETVEIEAVPVPDLWFTDADPSQIRDALLNLALNARDAMPSGGALKIEAANLHLGAQAAAAYGELSEGDFVVLTVTDTGVGMPQSVLQRAIEPFFTTKPPSVGSGLGLSIVYGFAKQSGGHLDIDSTVGAGTRVRLFLPRARDRSMRTVDAPSTLVLDPAGTETILLVEDNEGLLAVTCRNLTARGYKVIAATSGRMALATLESGEAVDLLFTDMVMPGGMSGPDLARAARRLNPRLKVLFTTGYAAESLEQQEEYVLHKPYDRRSLARAIRTVLDGIVTSGPRHQSFKLI